MAFTQGRQKADDITLGPIHSRGDFIPDKGPVEGALPNGFWVIVNRIGNIRDNAAVLGGLTADAIKSVSILML